MEVKFKESRGDWIIALGFAVVTFGFSSIGLLFASYWWFRSGAHWFAGIVLVISVCALYLTLCFLRRLKQLRHENKG